MKNSIFAAVLGMALLNVTSLFAQHSDIEFGYNNLASSTSFVLENDYFTTDNVMYWEADFVEDTFVNGLFKSDEPGFTTNAAEDLLINTGDRIFLRVLNAQAHSTFGVGYVNFFNPSTGTLQSSLDRRILAEHNTSGLNDLIFNGVGLESGDNPLWLGLGNSTGNLHQHIEFELLNSLGGEAPLFGAYGVMFRLESDFASNGFNGTDLTSDPFWIIWNHGMDHDDFENIALPAFGAGAIPEPGAFTLLALSSIGMIMRRRR